MTYRRWSWQQEDWPNFAYDQGRLDGLEHDYLKESGVSVGVMKPCFTFSYFYQNRLRLTSNP
jgi:Domain of unknown function (DUF4172)